jgi:DNA-binding PadR family transcriptional regulator
LIFVSLNLLQLDIIAALSRGALDAKSIGQSVRAACIDHPSLSAIYVALNKLERDGFVTRTRDGPSRQDRAWGLTADGLFAFRGSLGVLLEVEGQHAKWKLYSAAALTAAVTES